MVFLCLSIVFDLKIIFKVQQILQFRCLNMNKTDFLNLSEECGQPVGHTGAVPCVAPALPAASLDQLPDRAPGWVGAFEERYLKK